VGEHEADPLQQRAAEIFAEQLAGIEFLLSERFARNSVLASHVHNDCRSTWPQRPEGMAKTCGIADPAHQLPRCTVPVRAAGAPASHSTAKY
jgi:hypothetical protein